MSAPEHYMSGHPRKRRAEYSDNSNAVSLEELASPNFEELARQFPDFGRAWKDVERTRRQRQAEGESATLASSVTQTFTISLTKALLHVYFRVSLCSVNETNLCPPVPNRYFYVQWIQKDLLPLLKSGKYFQNPVSSLGCVGLDIGTGPVCIYPLLFAASSPCSYRLYATDVDPESVEMARQNVQANPAMRDTIEVLLVAPSTAQQQNTLPSATSSTDGAFSFDQYKGPLRTSLDRVPHRAIDFCMTNPPFYDQQMTEHRAGDSRQRTAMTRSEGSYPNGEVGFVLDMIVDCLGLYFLQTMAPADSSSSPPPPAWSSCMCGKKTSWIKLKHIVEQLLGYAHVRATEFGPGHLTRWFLAWTFQRPRIDSPLALSDHWSFVVDDANCHQVTQRVERYVHESSDLQVVTDDDSFRATSDAGKQQLLIREQQTNASCLVGDDALPERLRQILSASGPVRSNFLPVEGHFQISVSMASTTDHNVKVAASSFSHTRHGKLTVDRIRQQIQGEVCRTNRKWRRKQRRQDAGVDRMDES